MGEMSIQHARGIREMTEAEFCDLYALEGEVMESSHKGMSVRFVKRLTDGAKCVVKVRDRSCSFTSASEECAWRETTEFQLNMPVVDTLCQFYEVIETKMNYYVIMENVAGVDLFELMTLEQPNPVVTREIIHQILDGLKSLHDLNRIHKDVKTENVMVDMNSLKEASSPGSSPRSSRSAKSVKLIDFDTVQTWEPSSPKARDVMGTDGYLAPEAYDGDFSPASDIFAVGVIMYTLLTGRSPFPRSIFDHMPGENWVGGPAMLRVQARLKKQVIDFTRAPFPDLPDATDLCRKLLDYDSAKRPAAKDAMVHEWFKAEFIN